jgi:predicted nucleotidyltransferase/uncharacterized protein with HEPN domain
MTSAQPPTLAYVVARRGILERIATAHGATNLRVCGSVARGDPGPDSDLDLVVDLDEERDVLDLIELVLDLQEELGRPVDVLAVSASERPSVHSPAYQIIAEAVPITAGASESRPLPSGDHDRRLLEELGRSVALARSYLAGGAGAFMGNPMAVDAATHRLGEIADACRRLSPDLKARHPEIRWRALTNLTVATRHGPRGCWELVTRHLTPLDRLIGGEAHP